MKIQSACCRGRKLIHQFQAINSKVERISRGITLGSMLPVNLDSEDSVRSPNVVFRNSWGSFQFIPYQLAGLTNKSEHSTIVVVHLQEQLSLAVFRGCRKLSLTEKQTEITILMSKGLSYETVATELHISSNTVIDHVRKIYDKLGVGNRIGLFTTLLLGVKEDANVAPINDAVLTGISFCAPMQHDYASRIGVAA